MDGKHATPRREDDLVLLAAQMPAINEWRFDYFDDDREGVEHLEPEGDPDADS